MRPLQNRRSLDLSMAEALERLLSKSGISETKHTVQLLRWQLWDFCYAQQFTEVAYESATIQYFLTGLEPFLLSRSLGLFDNATVNTCEESLQSVNRVFDGK